MPTRIIRDGILTSERVNALSPLAELFYRRLMSVADDHGRYSGNLTLIRSSCYPLKIDSVKEDSIKKHLAECVDVGLVVPYTVDGKPYIWLVDFGQRINGKSKFPGPPAVVHGESRGIPGDPRLDEDVVVFEDVVDNTSASAEPDLLEGIDPQVVRDFRTLRKAKKAAITPTVIAGIKREADKAGYTLENALRTCCERGWQGFKAEWVMDNSTPKQPARRQRKELE